MEDREGWSRSDPVVDNMSNNQNDKLFIGVRCKQEIYSNNQNKSVSQNKQKKSLNMLETAKTRYSEKQ